MKLDSTPLRLLLWVILLSPFLMLAYRYNELPDPLPLFRKLSGGVSVWAMKSPLTVFRVPLIGALMGAMLEIMRSHTDKLANAEPRKHYRSLWNAFLVTLAIKSVIQGIEFASLVNASPGLFMGATLLVVACGLAMAAIPARKIYLENRFKLDKLTKQEGTAMIVLAAIYLIVAFLPLLISKSAPPQIGS